MPNGSSQKPYLVIECDYINPLSDKSIELVREAAIGLRPTRRGYVIDRLGRREDVWRTLSVKRPIKKINRRGFLAFPGLVDLHFHWVQDDVRLMPKDSLMTWLENYTWPYEEKFKSLSYTQRRAKKFSRELLAVGTLAGLCYGSLHGHTVDEALKHFQGRFSIGNVLMTMNSPNYLTQTIDDAKALMKQKARKFKRSYALTPRFAPTTHPELMKLAKSLSEQHGSFIQTHLSENTDEISYVLELFKKIKGFEDIKNYTEIYQRCSLLGPQTVLGHCVHLSSAEWKLLQQTGTIIAHCPSSNAPVKEGGLGSGLFDFAKATKLNIPWALASDIGGGPYLSLFDVMHSFVSQNQKRGQNEATYTMALFRASAMGADVMGLSDFTGRLAKGVGANFFMVATPKIKKNASAEEVLKKLASSFARKRSRSDHLVAETYLDGQCVFKSRRSQKSS